MAPLFLFYEPRSAAGFLTLYNLPRLGGPILATMARNMGWQSEVYINRPSRRVLERFLDAKVVGVSSLTNTAYEAYAFACELRCLASQRHRLPPKLIMGGVHASVFPEEPLRNGFDLVVRGECEENFQALLRALDEDRPLWNIPGISFWNGKEITHNRLSSLPRDMDAIPVPDWSLVKDWQPNLIYPTWTSRGCLYNCDFCTVWTYNGQSMRIRDPKLVIEELRRIQDSVGLVFFYDDAFDLSNTPKMRKEEKSLLAEMARQRFSIPFSAQVTEHSFDDKEFLDLAEAAGMRWAYIGIESLNPDSIREIGKHQNKRTSEERYMAGISQYRSRGINVHGMFICGMDADTPDSLRTQAEFARDQLGITTAHFSILLPLPGAQNRCFYEEKGRILDNDWSHYDGLHTVIKPAKMTPSELQEAAYRSWQIFYTLPKKEFWRLLFSPLIKPWAWFYFMLWLGLCMSRPFKWLMKDRTWKRWWIRAKEAIRKHYLKLGSRLKIGRMIRKWWNEPKERSYREKLRNLDCPPLVEQEKIAENSKFVLWRIKTNKKEL